MNTLLKPVAVAASMLLASAASGMPARPGVVKALQPDGTGVEITLHGDEHLNWISTPDGFTLLRDSDGFLTFARQGASGSLAPSALRYSGSSAPALSAGIARGLHGVAPAPAKAPSAESLQIPGTFPSTGNQRLLLLLINYSDTEPTFASEDFNNLMNQEGYNGTGSFRDFYLSDSYGKLNITTTVTRWVTLPFPKSYYGSDGAQAMIVDALTILDNELDLNDFDNNGDGVLDGLAVIHQGSGAEASGNPNEIWSHSGVITGKKFDGVQLRRYTIEPEKLDDEISTIGVICHEFGHQLGAPDFYDVDYSSYGEYPGTGTWDLMASGGWNTIKGGHMGDRPAHTNIWQKTQLGWVEPVVLTESTEIGSMPPTTTEPVAYRFNTTVDGEYFLLENRQPADPFDMALPSHGLLVYHANDNMIARAVNLNTLNNKFPQSMYIVAAGSFYDPAGVASGEGAPHLYGTVNSDMAPFPGSLSRREFNDTTIPSTRSMEDGRYSYKGLADITENTTDGSISFSFVADAVPAGPRNLCAAFRRSNITVSWEAPAEGEKPLSYTIFRNGEKVECLESTSYTDTNIEGLTEVSYSVDATYADGLTSPASEVSVHIPGNRITDLTASAENGDVTLEWNLDTRLTRADNGAEEFSRADYYCDALEYAHRYRAEDLAIYRGYKIRRICFMPLQTPAEISCSVTVYEANPSTGELSVASQRALSEIGTLTWNRATLTKSVEISGEKDIWIAVRVQSKTGVVETLTDMGPVMQGYGNMHRRDNGEWSADEILPGNFYLYAELTEPAAKTETEAPEIPAIEDYMADTAFPLAFGIYRDGAYLGAVAGRRFTDRSVPEGVHTYEVTNLFKGSNESTPSTVEIKVGTSGVSSVAAERPEPTVTAVEGGILITGLCDPATVSDLSGRRVAVASADGFISLPAGLYIVSASGTRKVLVK